MEPDRFIERRSDVLFHNFAEAIEHLQTLWPIGTVLFPDDQLPVVWILPADPLSDEHDYTHLVGRLKTADSWAVIAYDHETLNKAIHNRGLGSSYFHIDQGCVWALRR